MEPSPSAIRKKIQSTETFKNDPALDFFPWNGLSDDFAFWVFSAFTDKGCTETFKNDPALDFFREMRSVTIPRFGFSQDSQIRVECDYKYLSNMLAMKMHPKWRNFKFRWKLTRAQLIVLVMQNVLMDIVNPDGHLWKVLPRYRTNWMYNSRWSVSRPMFFNEWSWLSCIGMLVDKS